MFACLTFHLNRNSIVTGNLWGLIYTHNLFEKVLLFDFEIFCFHKDADLARKALKPIERVLSSTSEEDEPGVVKFLKMNCRYFTDGKVYSNVICFLSLKSMKN